MLKNDFLIEGGRRS